MNDLRRDARLERFSRIAMPSIKLTLLSFGALLSLATHLATSQPALAEESHPGLMAEALYSEALIAFHRKQIDQAISILDKVLAETPNYADALELRALLLKNQDHPGNPSNEDEEIKTYERLIPLRPAQQAAPYHYELGVLYYRHGKLVVAKKHLHLALKAHFNSTICRFFLGMIAFGESHNRDAEHFFRSVSNEGNGELKLISLYYLGLIELRTSYPIGATRDLQGARKVAADLEASGTPSPTAKQILGSIDQVLAPFTTPQWFANATVLGQYNSNISQVSTSLTSQSQSVSGQGTGVLNVSGGIGRMTAPINDFQLVGSYRFSLNEDTNSNTKQFQFVTNTVSLFLNYLPLAEIQGGFKVEGNLMFQDAQSDPTDPNSSYSYSKYLLGAEVGPYFRYQLSRQVQTELDLYFRPQTYYTEPDLSGVTVFTRASVKADLLNSYLNPSGYVEYEHDNADGSDFKSNTVGVGVANMLKLTPRDFVTPAIDFLASQYPQNSQGRQDRYFSVHVDAVHSMNAHFSILGNMSYTNNSSTVPDTYSYHQSVVSLGVTYNL
jgi:hypothetical protein